MDADGVTSTAIMVRYLKNYTDKVDFIYGERGHGHGITSQISMNDEIRKDSARAELNQSNIDKVKACDLLIILDSSSNEDKVIGSVMSNFDIDAIILDHHEVTEEVNHSILVNPMQDGCEYPNKYLSGAGVVYKTLQVLEDLMGNKVNVDQYLDLVAVGIYADIMPVNILENRYLIMAGLRNMKNTGLIRILKGAKADLYRLNGDSIGFSIAPMINGVARLNNIKLAIDILLEDDDSKCKPIRLKMQRLNNERKEIQAGLVERYEELIDHSKKYIFVSDDDASSGFNGLIAQQLVSKYKKTAIVGRLHNGTFSGSFRGFGRFRMKSFLYESELTHDTGGHEGAGGISVSEENLEELIEYMDKYMPETRDDSGVVMYDIELSPDEANEVARDMDRLNLVTGSGFPKVVSKIKGLTVDDADIIGKTRETFKVKTFDEVELIRFRVDEHTYGKDIGVFDNLDVVGVLSVNEFYHFGLKKKIITNQVIIDEYKVK